MKSLLHPDRPFAPRRFPFFYGWWIVVVGTLGVLMSMPGQTSGVSVFIDHLIAATGFSRLQLSNAYLIGTLASGLCLPYGGTLLDRLGARRLAVMACIGLGVTLLVLTSIDRMVSGVGMALPFATSFSGVVVLSAAFGLLRFTGQGLLTMVSRAMVVKWFDRRRGLVAGITGVFTSFGFSVAPSVLLFWVGVVGWRVAWAQMAAVVGLGMATVAYVFFRDNPEECGLRMDGDASDSEAAGSGGSGLEPGYTRAEALRTPGFWFITFPLTVQAMMFTGVTFHILDIGAEAGLSSQSAVGLFIPVALLSIPMGFTIGVASDHVRLQLLVMAMTLLQALGFIGVGQLDVPLFYGMAIAGWGLSGGFYGPLLSVAIPKFFGRTHLGAISSVQLSCMVVGSALGPAALALSKEWLGGYALGLRWACLLSACGFVLAALSRTPRARRS